MFDWNDEELANIIWGEAGEIDDHIVPHPKESEEKPPGLYGDHIKKEWNREATNAKPAAQMKPVAKIGFAGGKQDSFSHENTEGISAAGYTMDPCRDLSLSHAAKAAQDSMGTEVSNFSTEITKYDSSRGDETSQVDNGSEIFQNQHEDTEQNDFDDYGWANIGSFDDLDKLFSNNDPIFGHESLDKADQLWSSSEDVARNPEKSFPSSMDSPSLSLGALSTSGHFEVKTEYVEEQDKSFTHDYKKMNSLASTAQQNIHSSAYKLDYAGDKNKPVGKEKTDLEMLGKTPAFNSHHAVENITTRNEVNNREKILKNKIKSEEGREGQQLHNPCSTWSPCGNQFQHFGQIAPSMPQTCTSSVLSQHTQLQGPASSQHQHSPEPFIAHSVYGSVQNRYSTMTISPKIHSREVDQHVLSGYEVSASNSNPLSRSPGIATKPLTMTPQEKVEKLRRRQQMQALLAIQKQQQQLSQVSSNDHSSIQKFLHLNQIQLMQEGKVEVEENVSTLPSIDPNSSLEKEDSNTISMEAHDYYFVEDTILHQLQDTIGKLDIQIRLCIRDSLFRLAQSAMQRHYTSDTSSTNKNSQDELDLLTKEEPSSHSRYTRMPDVETETNHIDRTVAHLLFHRSLESSGKDPEILASPALTKLSCERKTAGLLGSPRGFLPDNYKSKPHLSYHGSENLHVFAEGDRSGNSPSIDSSENASHGEAADAAGMVIEASQ